MPTTYTPHPDKVSPNGCISIIGMAAAGKTTLGRELAALLDWPQMDTDHLIEATYGAPLQGIADMTAKEEFLDIEGGVVSRIMVSRSIISTGGSVVYRKNAMEHLQKLGPILYLDVELSVILERIARKPERGLAIAPGQTIEDLFYERKALYESFASVTIPGGEESSATYAAKAAAWLALPHD